MASPECELIKRLYGSWAERMAAQPDMDLETLRDIFEEWHLLTAEPEGVSYAEDDAGGVPAIWCIPEGCADDRVLIWTHGGGYVVGSMHSHRKVAGHLAKAAGTRALVIDYRRAPENPHPAQVEDAVASYRWLVDQGIRPEHIGTTGDSAGGALCTSMVLKLRDDGDALPACILPQSPWYDMEGKGETLDSRASVDTLVQREILMNMAAMFLGPNPANDPLANPLYADPAGLPPMLIHVGDHETLLDDSVRFAKQAEAAGVDVTLEVQPEMQHVFQFMAGRAREADASIARLGSWAREKLGLG
jgi:acetyl esterase/lipase